MVNVAADFKEEMKVLIIIPAYNEEESITDLLDEIICDYPQYDYVVINDGSTDHTEDILRDGGYNHLCLPLNLGIGGAVQAGYLYAQAYDYDAAAQIDGDGQHDISFLGKMLDIIRRNDADIVIGSRFIEREGFQSSAMRRTGIRILSNLILLCTFKRIKDVTSGYRLVNRRFIDVYAGDYPTDYPEPEAIITAIMNRGRICEYPVIMRERAGGVSSINAIKGAYYMIKVSLSILMCRLSYGVRRCPREK